MWRGCGPVENRNLEGQLPSKGLINAEFQMGSTALPMNFPIRNRIIRGMSVGWLVVEGA